MPPKTAECRECNWEGPLDSLESYKCPQCGSRRLKTEGSRLSQKKNLNPPKDARQGEDYTAE